MTDNTIDLDKERSRRRWEPKDVLMAAADYISNSDKPVTHVHVLLRVDEGDSGYSTQHFTSQMSKTDLIGWLTLHVHKVIDDDGF